MARSTAVRWLLTAALSVAVLWPHPAPASGESCEAISAYQQTIGSGAGTGPSLSVPLVIHIMERPGHGCGVRQHWTSRQVATVFGPGTEDQRGVNSVWRSTKIRFQVREVLLHEYDPPDVLLASVPSGPEGSPEFEAAFQRLVTAFHRAGSVNVYLWERIHAGPMGFGRSPRSGNGKASVWLDRVCLNPSLVPPERCARTAAHELGHSLGLYHSGPDRCLNVQDEFRELCQRVTAPCGEGDDKDRLMAAGRAGRLLCPEEAAHAESMVGRLE